MGEGVREKRRKRHTTSDVQDAARCVLISQATGSILQLSACGPQFQIEYAFFMLLDRGLRLRLPQLALFLKDIRRAHNQQGEIGCMQDPLGNTAHWPAVDSCCAVRRHRDQITTLNVSLAHTQLTAFCNSHDPLRDITIQ